MASQLDDQVHGLEEIVDSYVIDEGNDHEKYIQLANRIHSLNSLSAENSGYLKYAEMLVIGISNDELKHKYMLLEVRSILSQIEKSKSP